MAIDSKELEDFMPATELEWSDTAIARMKNVPFFVRKSVVRGIEQYAKDNNLEILARIVSTSVQGCKADTMGLGPIGASQKALERAKLTIKDIDIVELNEAFASQSLACIKDLQKEGHF